MRPRTRLSALVALTASAAGLALPSAAGAFGTIDGHMDQHAEHEKITRVLGCGAVDGAERCFEPLSLDQLAGKSGTLGGVGIPDNPAEILNHPEAHCDDGDYLPGRPYGAPDAARASRAIADCVDHFDRRIEQALEAAGAMLDADGRVLARQTTSVPDCNFAQTAVGFDSDVAKCRVFNGLGRALHTAEDFWSHSNWADEANAALPATLPSPEYRPPAAGDDAQPSRAATVFNIANPVGLGRTEVVPFLRYPVPRGLIPTAAEEAAGTAPISGCDDSPQSKLEWINTVRDWIGRKDRFELCPDRVGHSVLNKDKGMIDPKTGRTWDPDDGTPRGLVADNFQRAVTGARAQARAVWGDFQAAVVARYGAERGETILRALTTDTPWTSCELGGGGAFALGAPNGGDGNAARSVDAAVDNRTGETLTCESARLRSGGWASLPPDATPAGAVGRFRIESRLLKGGGGGPEGQATLAIGDSGYAVQVAWDNPMAGSNRMSCQILRDGAAVASAPYRCTVQGGSGFSARPTYLVTR